MLIYCYAMLELLSSHTHVVVSQLLFASDPFTKDKATCTLLHLADSLPFPTAVITNAALQGKSKSEGRERKKSVSGQTGEGGDLDAIRAQLGKHLAQHKGGKAHRRTRRPSIVQAMSGIDKPACPDDDHDDHDHDNEGSSGPAAPPPRAGRRNSITAFLSDKSKMPMSPGSLGAVQE